MNAYERLQSALAREFKQKAQPQFCSLWADLMELEEATDAKAFSAARDQALRRVQTMECAAHAVRAHPISCLSRSLELKLRVLPRANAPTRPESLETLHRAMNRLAEALYSGDMAALNSENPNQPTETLLVESCAN